MNLNFVGPGTGTDYQGNLDNCLQQQRSRASWRFLFSLSSGNCHWTNYVMHPRSTVGGTLEMLFFVLYLAHIQITASASSASHHHQHHHHHDTTYHVLIIKKVNYTRRPFRHGHRIGRVTNQSKQAECGALFHRVQCITDNIKHKFTFTSQTAGESNQ